jgi:hypothetical protein
MINVGEKAEVGAGACLLALIGVANSVAFQGVTVDYFFPLYMGFFLRFHTSWFV